jgi:hypothetical protein
MRRLLLAVVLGAALVGVDTGAAGAAPWAGAGHGRGVSIGGAVTTPMTYSLGQLKALPQTSFTVHRRMWRGTGTVTDAGVPVEDLVNTAEPTVPTAKNAQLRVTVTVAGRRGRDVTFALGELDPNFGAHPAYLVLTRNGRALRAPELVVPGDVNDARAVSLVDRITVAVQSPAPTTPPSPGSVTIEDRGFSKVLSAGILAALPARTVTVSFQAGTAPQSHTESGPSLDAVLSAAHIRTDLNTWVAAVGSDGYVAVVTPAEAWVGGRPLLISLAEDGQPLAQPRLVTDGDVKGGRYVSGVVDLAVGPGLAPGVPWRSF